MGEDGRTSSIHQRIKLLDKGVVQRGSGEPAPTLEWSKVVDMEHVCTEEIYPKCSLSVPNFCWSSTKYGKKSC